MARGHCLRDAEQSPHSERFHLLSVEDLDRETLRLECHGPLGEACRKEHIGGLRDEVAGQEDALGYLFEGREFTSSRSVLTGRNRDRGEARPVLRLFPRPVLVEAVAPEQGAVAKVRRERSRDPVAEDRRRRLLSTLLQFGDDAPAGRLHDLAVKLAGGPEPDDENAACREARRRQQCQGLGSVSR